MTRVIDCSTNLFIRPLHTNFLNSADYLASHSTEVRLRGSEARENVLYQELLHPIFDIRMPHDERRKANGHVESTILLRSLGVRAQNVVDKVKDRHESNFRSTLHQLGEEGRCSGERGIKVIPVVCKWLGQN